MRTGSPVKATARSCIAGVVADHDDRSDGVVNPPESIEELAGGGAVERGFEKDVRLAVKLKRSSV